jgi:hypothetical protein
MRLGRQGRRGGPAVRGLMVLILSGSVSLVGLPAAAATTPSTVRPAALAPQALPAGVKALGPVPAGTGLHLTVGLAPSDPDDLASLLAELYTPGSSGYHRWLTPAEYQADFAPAPAEVASVESWLHAKGLTDTTVTDGAVDVAAPAGVVSTALGTALERYRLPGGATGFLDQTTPEVPSSLGSGQVTGIIGLDTVATYQSYQSTAVQKRAVQSGAQSGAQASGGAQAAGGVQAAGVGAGCAGSQNAAGQDYYTLPELGAAYGVSSLIADGQDGRGERIGVFELAAHSTSDVSTYLSCFALTNPVTTVSVDGGGTTSSDGTGEADLDIEDAATQAPGAQIVSYEGPNTALGTYALWSTIVSQDAVQVVSTSWGICEPAAASDGTIGEYSTLFEQAAAQGQTILAASGDSGSEGCYTEYASGSSTQSSEQVQYPSSDPWVTAVGGTDLFGPGDEVAWNDCEGKGTGCAADPLVDGKAASGGGLSRYEPRPSYEPADLSWTTTEPCGTTTCREVPDISANAGVGMVVYVNGQWVAGGGTSFSAPFMAGLVADRDNGCTTLAGAYTPDLYAAAAQGMYGTGLTDITSGNTDMTDTNNGAYPAAAGWDPATGLGSPMATGLTCPDITEPASGYPGQQVTLQGLGLEQAAISIGGTAAPVVGAGATSVTIVVPDGTGTVSIQGTNDFGTGSQTATFTYTSPTNPSPTNPSPPTTPVVVSTPPQATPRHGYWLVGADGGIFSYGDANFYGSTGNLHLNRPVVGITPTADRGGYWLVATDGGIFAFGDSRFYGSIPGLGISPAGTGTARSLNAPIVGMVPSTDGGGYFMVASDGGVFAFGNAKFAGSCPGIGGCDGTAVAVLPDSTGNGYWLVTNSGNIYSFGDATYHGAPGPQASPVTSAVRTPDGNGYWILHANGVVDGYGDAADYGSLANGATSTTNPANAIFATGDGGGYWVATASGNVVPFGDAPADGNLTGTHINAPIIAATGN